jgi:tetratricopeptide (TPR) repeat protein
MTMARVGDWQKAESIVIELDRRSPRDTLIQHYSLPSIRAAILLDRNDPAGAVEALKQADGYDFAFPSFLNEVYPAYLRGLALLRMGKGYAAAIEFQKVIDHPGIVGREVIGAIVWFQMGRAQEVAGDSESARKSYRHFFELWQHADPDVPILEQAKAEFEKLQ